MINETADILSKLSPQQRELLLLKLTRKNKEKSEQSAIKKQALPNEPLTLSYSQERQWLLEQMNPASGAYNMTAAVRIRGSFQPDIFEKACNEIVRRHDGLRTRFDSVEGKPVQIIEKETDFKIAVKDLTASGDEEKAKEVRQQIISDSKTPFRIEDGNLLKISVLKLAAEEHIVSLVMHHIISDGWSMEILISDLSKIYDAFVNGKPSPLEELPVQYADYAIWQKSWLREDILEKHLVFWEDNLKDAEVLELPTDYPRPPVPTFRGAQVTVEIDMQTSQALKDLARSEGITVFMLLMSVWKTLLSIYSNQTDISVGSFIANRKNAETENLIGFFINNLTFRTDLSGNPKFRELLKRVKETALNAFAHQDIPFEMVLEKVSPERDFSRTRLFQTMVVLQNMPEGKIQLSEMQISPVKEAGPGRSNFDLTLWMWETPGGLGGQLEYSLDLFKEETAKRLVGHFGKIIENVLKNPEIRLSELSLLDAKEKETLLNEWNSDEVGGDLEKFIFQIIEENALAEPETVAVKFKDRELTYEQLDKRANQLANYLRENGIGVEDRVAISLERSVELVVAVLGVMRSGAAYVPLDPNYPEERLLYIMEDSGATFLITQAAIFQRVSQMQMENIGEKANNVKLFVMDMQADLLDSQPETSPAIEINPENAAYIIYTSGSTRRPRGVQITHKSLMNAFYAWEKAYRLKGNIKINLQMASFSFDVFVSDFTRTLGNGGTLVICPEEIYLEPSKLYELIENEKIESAEIVPSILRVLIQYLEENGKRLTTMKMLIAGADAIYGQEFGKLENLTNADALVLNSYGLTEATIDSTYYSGGAKNLKPQQVVPLGKPFANTKAYILNKSLIPVPIGIPGELVIGGPSLARGYLNNADLTAEKFIPDPFGGKAGARLYKTGDLAKYDQDGNIYFLGRLDYQVKIRGFRIELEEIESVLNEHENIKESIVVARGKDGKEKSLIAYFVSEKDNAVDVSELKQQMKASLPAYMIPSAIVPLEKFPLNPNGKIDRKNLPEPSEENFIIEENYEPPGTEIEELLVSIFEEVLGRTKIGIFDNFFEIGGHSLLATQVVSRINQRLEITLPLREIFITPNIAELGLKIEEMMLEELEEAEEEFI